MFLLLVVCSSSTFAFPKIDEVFYFAWDSFDPNVITTSDPNVEVFAELPSGDYALRNYRAPASMIEKFSRLHNIAGGDLKDFPLAPDCTRAEIEALRLWTSNDIYKEVNKALRYGQKGKVEGKWITEKTESEALLIASAIQCIPQYEGIAARIEEPPKVILDQYIPGKYIFARGFTSTSKGPEVLSTVGANNYKRKIVYSYIKGADIDKLGVAWWPAEKEVLVAPGAVFKVHDRKEFNSPSKFLTELKFEQVKPN